MLSCLSTATAQKELSLHAAKIEMHSVAADGQLSKRIVPLIEDGEEPTPVELQHVMPAQDFFASVGSSKDAISAALESIQAGEPDLVAGRKTWVLPARGIASICSCTGKTGNEARPD